MTGKVPYAIVKVSGRKVVIPKEIREILKIKVGDRMVVYCNLEDNSIDYIPAEEFFRR